MPEVLKGIIFFFFAVVFTVSFLMLTFAIAMDNTNRESTPARKKVPKIVCLSLLLLSSGSGAIYFAPPKPPQEQDTRIVNHKENLTTDQMLEEIKELQTENRKLRTENGQFRTEIEELRTEIIEINKEIKALITEDKKEQKE